MRRGTQPFIKAQNALMWMQYTDEHRLDADARKRQSVTTVNEEPEL